MDNKSGKMAPNMMVNGNETKLMATVLSSMLTEMFTKASGTMIKLTDMEHISMQMELHTLETGLKINNTARELRNGLMVLNMKETTKTARKMEMAA
jgi:hypothetical protein